MNGYIGFYEGKRYEVHAETLLEARNKVAALAKKDHPRHGDRRLVYGSSVMLAEKDGQPVIHRAVD